MHSAGVESAVADGRVTDLVTLEHYLVGRLTTVGLTEAALATATMVVLGTVGADRDRGIALAILDDEAGARLPVAALREASRRQGRQLVRVAGRAWPSVVLVAVAERHPDGVHLPVALGATAVAAGLEPSDVAALSLHHAITTPAQAALRLLGLDPFAVAALTAQLATRAEQVAAAAVVLARGVLRDDATIDRAALADLPAASGPLVDIAAVEHRSWDMRLFAT